MAKSKKAVAQSTVESKEVEVVEVKTAKSKKASAVVSSNVETKVEEVNTEVVTSVETITVEGLGEVEVTTTVEEPAVEQPSMLATMLQQEVKPLEEVVEEKPEVKVEKNQGVGAFVRKLIAEGLTNTAILKIVHEQYGNTNTTYACVAWYRNKMKKAGVVAKNAEATNIVAEMLKEEAKQEVPPEGFAQEATDQNPGFPESEV